ncbi:uncharacterized protein IL334_000239 [Kwoniella shivajii]|uniref:Myotubularin phosphatase domain-containing protein n=1 Tax=Kwoniella shivajii TaxID=564305 RepID=A0ABZ1CQ35_9TREE|nr:hypothetical protein IL334_000239 [Kwoniella shivajii]
MDTLRVARVENVILEQFVPPSTTDGQPKRDRNTGTLHLTPHHLIFSQTSPSRKPTEDPNQHHHQQQQQQIETWIPYPSITLLTRLPQSISGLYPLRIETKYFDNYVLLFEKDRDGGSEDVWQSVKDCAVKNSVEQLHAFFYHSTTRPKQPNPQSDASSSSASASASASTSSNPPSNGWSIYNPRNEFTRQGLGSDKNKSWRLTDINREYQLSQTYPNKLVAPTRISDSTLSYASKYRSKGRIPALSYLHWANKASITRSSQPMVGLKNSRSAQDERLVECIFSTHLYPEAAYSSPVYGATTTNLIIDARPTTNAMANVAMGAGTENMENYKLGKKAYLGIDNIHVMRNSLKIIIEAIRETESKPSGILDRTLLRKSNWLKHISTILDGSLIIIRNIHLNASHVLIHCSDGWDRTAQLSAVSQVCLDPYYRTIEGFNVLIEKDFLSFGHKFLDRSGHLSSEKIFVLTENNEQDSDEDEGGAGAGAGASRAAQAFFATVQKTLSSSSSTSHLKEVSPVFHQFLDCTRQIQRQYPERFQFNEQYLLDIYYHLYSCQFGTFIFNNERERQSYLTKTASVWDHLNGNKSNYLNETYDPKIDKENDDQGVLLFDPKNVKFWFRLFRRGDEEMNGSTIVLSQAQGVDSIGPITSTEDDPISIPNGLARAVSPPINVDSPAKRQVGLGLPASGSGWNWSGAFNVVQSAGRQIKTISQDAINQLKAEAGEVEDFNSNNNDPWNNNLKENKTSQLSANDPLISTITPQQQPNDLGRKEYKPYIPKTNFRIPSETNPWSSSNFNETITKPTTSRINSNPWSTADRSVPDPNAIPDPKPRSTDTFSPSLSNLSLKDKPKTSSVPSALANDDDELIRAAMGEDKKAWDPLGAL